MYQCTKNDALFHKWMFEAVFLASGRQSGIKHCQTSKTMMLWVVARCLGVALIVAMADASCALSHGVPAMANAVKAGGISAIDSRAGLGLQTGSNLGLRGGEGEGEAAVIPQIGTKEQFDEFVKEGLVVCDFYATWCGPCHKISPKFEEYSYEFPDVKFCKVDVDANADTATACGVTCMPTFQMFNNGVKNLEIMGADPVKLHHAIKDFLKRVRVEDSKAEAAAAAT